MCVLYVSFGSKVRPRTFGCSAMGSVVVFILRSILLLYSVGSGVQVVLSGISVRLLYVLSRQNCMYIWLYVLLGCTRAFVCSIMVMLSA